MLIGELLREVDRRLATDDHEGALDMLQQALALYPLAWSLRRPTVLALSKMGRTEEALSAAKTALEIQPEDPELWRIVGELSQGHSREQAARAFRNALLFEPANLQLQETLRNLGSEADLYSDLRLGWLHLFQGMVDIAQEELLAAEAEDPLMARLGLLKVALTRDNLGEASKTAADLLAVYPQLLPALVVSALEARESGDAGRFQERLQQLREVDPDGSGTATSMAQLLRRHPLPEMEGLRVDIPVQEPLAKEDLQALEELDEHLSVELMLLATPEGQGIGSIEDFVAVDDETLGSSIASAGGEEAEEVTGRKGQGGEVPEGGEAKLEPSGVPVLADIAEAPSSEEPEPLPGQLEAELATVEELVAQVDRGETSAPRQLGAPNGLARLVIEADKTQLEDALELVRSASNVDPELQHRLLALAYRRMGLGLEALGEVIVSMRYRSKKGS